MRHPELEPEDIQMGKDILTRTLNGIVNFLVSSLVYAGISWYALGVLRDAGVVNWEFSWVQVSTLVLFLQFARVWDRALMR